MFCRRACVGFPCFQQPSSPSTAQGERKKPSEIGAGFFNRPLSQEHRSQPARYQVLADACLHGDGADRHVRYDRFEREVFSQLVALELVDQDAPRAVDDPLVGGGYEHVRHGEPQVVVLLCPGPTLDPMRARWYL